MASALLLLSSLLVTVAPVLCNTSIVWVKHVHTGLLLKEAGQKVILAPGDEYDPSFNWKITRNSTGDLTIQSQATGKYLIGMILGGGSYAPAGGESHPIAPPGGGIMLDDKYPKYSGRSYIWRQTFTGLILSDLSNYQFGVKVPDEPYKQVELRVTKDSFAFVHPGQPLAARH